MPLFWLSLAFLAGILLAANINLQTSAWILIAGISLLFSAIIRFLVHRFNQIRNSDRASPTPVGYFIYTLIPLVLFLGQARFQATQSDLTSQDFIAYYNDRGLPVTVTGVLVKPPHIGDGYVDLKVGAERIMSKGNGNPTTAHGLVSAKIWEGSSASLPGDWRYGDRLALEGRLVTPPEYEDFSFREYLAHKGVYSEIDYAQVTLLSSGGGNPIVRLTYAYRDRALAAVYRLWPDPEASLFAGILLGDKGGISEEVYQTFRDTGTAHVIVISGFNITILAGLLVWIFSRLLGRGQFGVRRAVVVAFVGIFTYAVLVGGEAAVVRAAIMGGLGLFAVQVGRRQSGINTLAIVAAGMAIFNPNILWDVGFQLSFAATLGLVLYATPLQESFVRFANRYLPLEAAQKLSRPVGEYILFTLAAQVLIIPISLYYFQKLSLISIIANPLVLPAQPPLMVLGGVATLLGTVYLPLGQVFAWLAWPFAAYTIRAVELLAEIPGGSITLGAMSVGVLSIFYAGLFALTFAAARVKGFAGRVAPGIAVFGLLAVTALIWRVALAAPDGKLHLTVLDVDCGDSLLIQTPAGRVVLIDGGSSTTRLSEQLGRRLPFGMRGLDWLVVAAAGDEYIGGLERNLERFPPANVLWSGQTDGTQAARALWDDLIEAGIQPVEAATGQVLDLGEGAVLRVISTGKLGATLMLEWGSFRALLPIGLDFETLERLQEDRALRQVTTLLLAQCGYAPVNPKEWIGKLRPQVVLLNADSADPRGAPSPETLEAVEGYTLLRTDRNGWIELTTDGKQMWVEVERR